MYAKIWPLMYWIGLICYRASILISYVTDIPHVTDQALLILLRYIKCLFKQRPNPFIYQVAPQPKSLF